MMFHIRCLLPLNYDIRKSDNFLNKPKVLIRHLPIGILIWIFAVRYLRSNLHKLDQRIIQKNEHSPKRRQNEKGYKASVLTLGNKALKFSNLGFIFIYPPL